MNNWHIKIEDCTGAQKERLKQVYGKKSGNYFGFNVLGYPTFYDCKPDSELITPDEAFERLGLGEDTKALTKCENSIVKAQKQLTRRTAKLREFEQIIEELTQQLEKVSSQRDELYQVNEALRAAKSELQGVDWSKAPKEAVSVVQTDFGIYFLDCGYTVLEGDGKLNQLEKDDFILLAARPKPKYTPEQIEAVKDFDAWVSRRHKLSGEFNWWLKEVGNE